MGNGMVLRKIHPGGPIIKDPFIGRMTIAERLGLLKDEFNELLRKKRFPKPNHYALGADPRWRTSIVDEWLEQHRDYVEHLISRRADSCHAAAY